jgi:hypothetical protein
MVALLTLTLVTAAAQVARSTSPRALPFGFLCSMFPRGTFSG